MAPPEEKTLSLPTSAQDQDVVIVLSHCKEERPTSRSPSREATGSSRMHEHVPRSSSSAFTGSNDKVPTTERFQRFDHVRILQEISSYRTQTVASPEQQGSPIVLRIRQSRWIPPSMPPVDYQNPAPSYQISVKCQQFHEFV
jgi:hypothetical protein